MKRVISIVLLTALLLLSACAGKSESTSSEPVTVPEETTDTQSGTVSKNDSTPPPVSEESPLQAAQGILSGIAYYGDLSKCEMTVEQALAYAQLMADGIAGIAFYDEWNEETTIRFWDHGFSADGYGGPYKTSRDCAVLGDFSGDGNPYLYLFDAEKDCSFTIYGWQNGTAKQLMDVEDWGGRSFSYLTSENIGQGLAQLHYSGTGGAADHMSEQYAFVNGDLICVESWHEYYDYTDSCWHIVENGEDQTYSQEEFDALYAQQPEAGPTKTSPELQAYTGYSLTQVCDAPNTLREMIAALNEYATTLSGNTADRVTLREPSEQLIMATDMLGVLNGYWDVTDAVLFDMDGNGTQELLVAHFDNFAPECDVYFWNDGALSKQTYGGGLTDHIRIIQNRNTGEYGIFTGAYTDATDEAFCYPSGRFSLLLLGYEGEREPSYHRYENGNYENRIDLTEDEYYAELAQHEIIREFNTNHWDSTGELDTVKAALRSMN